MCRGNRREEIFRDDADRKLFLHTLGQACGQTGWVVHSYVLMSNHYHLLLETPEANLSAGMRWFQGTYAQRYCKRHALVGHVFQGRYKAPLIDGNKPEYFRVASDYIHLNPARARLFRGSRPTLAQYKWSSYPLFLRSKRQRPSWLQCERVAGSLGFRGDDSASRRRYRAYLEERARDCLRMKEGEEVEEWEQIRRGWYVGDEKFRDRLLDLLEKSMKGKKKASFGGRILAAHNEKRAMELIEQSRKQLGLAADELRGLRKTDVRKQSVVWLIKTHTVMSNEWIDRQLDMGSRTNIHKAVVAMERPSDAAVRSIRKRLVNI